MLHSEDADPSRRGVSWRRAAVLAALVPLLLWVASLTQFESRVRLSSDGQRVHWQFGGSTLTADVPLTRVRRIEIFATESLLPVGGRHIRIEEGGKVLLDEPLPRRFELQRGRNAPVGDWWVDGMSQSPPTLVWSRDIAVDGPFTLEAAFTGRCSDATRIVVHGDAPLRFDFRWGLINHDFAIVRSEHEILTASEWQADVSPLVLGPIETMSRAAAAAALLVLVFMAVAWAGRRWRGWAIPRPAWWTRACVGAAITLAAALGGIAYACWGYILHGVPHLPDSLVYLLQAKWLLAGRIYMDPPPFVAQLDIPLTFVKEGKWLAHYPIGWPLLLAVGEALAQPGVVAPLCGAISMALVFSLGRALWGPGAGLMAAVLTMLSPLTLMLSAEPMAHAATAALVQCAFLCVITGAPEGRLGRLAIAGVAMGYAFGMRPLTAIAMSMPLTLFLLWPGGSAGGRRRLAGVGLFAAGGLLGALPVLIANAKTTGSPLLFAYTWAGGHVLSLGHFRTGVMLMDSTLAMMLPALRGWGWPWVNGWPLLALGLGLALVPFLAGRARRTEWLLLGGFLVLPLAYTLHGGHGMHGYGARFYYEAFFCLHLLAVAGFFTLARLDGTAREPGRVGTAGVLAAALFVAAVASSLVTLPGRIRLYRGYNFVTGNFDAALGRAGVTRGLVLLQGQWWDWAEVGRHLGPDLRADLAFARFGGDNAAVFEFYPDRPVFTWSAPMFVDAHRDLAPLR